MEITLLFLVVFIIVLEMKSFFPSFLRTTGLALLASGFCSCSLFKNGKYASQWEIQTDVPASLNSGNATVPDEKLLATHPVKSNLSGQAPPAMDEMNFEDQSGGLSELNVNLPKPDMSMLEPSKEQALVEMINLPGSGGTTDLPVASSESPSSADTLLDSPPPMVTDADLAAVPRALPPAAPETMSDSVIGAPPVKTREDSTHQEHAPGKSPARIAAAPGIPPLYSKLDQDPSLPPASAEEVKPEPTPGEDSSLSK